MLLHPRGAMNMQPCSQLPGSSPRARQRVFVERGDEDGLCKLVAVAAQLNAERLPTRTGTPWRARAVRQILRRATVLS
jgi:hypothetical protein